MATVDLIPDALLLEIFRMIPFRHRFSVSKVCHRWRTISKDFSLWKSIDVSKGKLFRRKITDKILCSWLRKIGKLIQCVNVRNCTQLTDKVLTTIGYFCRNIRRIDITGCTKMSDNGMKDIAAYCRQLEEVKVYMTSITDKHFCRMFKNLGSKISAIDLPDEGNTRRLLRNTINLCKCIRKISISDAMPFGENDENTVTDAEIIMLIDEFTALEDLTLNWCCGITDCGLQAIGNKCKNLKKLGLKECHGISKEGVNIILAKCHVLSELHLERLFFLGVHLPLRVEKELQNLRSLKFIDCSLDDNDVQMIIKSAPHLKELHVRDSSFVSPNICQESLLVAVRFCRKLESIHFFTAKALDYNRVVKSLTNCEQLRELSMSFNVNLTFSDLSSILKSSKTLKKLRFEEFGKDLFRKA